VNFTVDSSAAPRACFHGTPLLPVEAETGDGDDLVQLILMARHGWLESLEIVYYSREPPTEFPAPTDLRLVTVARGSEQDTSEHPLHRSARNAPSLPDSHGEERGSSACL
jgi:hypothetical protein